MRVESVHRRGLREFLEHRDFTEMIAHEVQLPVEFRDPAGGPSTGRAHLSNQETAVFGGKKVVRDGGFHRFGRKQEAGTSGLADVEEKDPVLSFIELKSPPHARSFPVAFRWQWWASFPILPGGGSGTVVITLP